MLIFLLCNCFLLMLCFGWQTSPPQERLLGVRGAVLTAMLPSLIGGGLSLVCSCIVSYGNRLRRFVVFSSMEWERVSCLAIPLC